MIYHLCRANGGDENGSMYLQTFARHLREYFSLEPLSKIFLLVRQYMVLDTVSFIFNVYSGGSRISLRGANSQNCCYFSNFCRKLHENERIWTPRGVRPSRPFGSTNGLNISHFSYTCKTEGKNGISCLISTICVNCLSSIPEYSRIIDYSIICMCIWCGLLQKLHKIKKSELLNSKVSSKL